MSSPSITQQVLILCALSPKFPAFIVLEDLEDSTFHQKMVHHIHIQVEVLALLDEAHSIPRNARNQHLRVFDTSMVVANQGIGVESLRNENAILQVGQGLR